MKRTRGMVEFLLFVMLGPSNIPNNGCAYHTYRGPRILGGFTFLKSPLGV